MQSKFCIIFAIVALLSLISLSKASHECFKQIQDLEETFTDLNHAIQDQDVFGVFLGLKSVVKAAKPLKEACGEQDFEPLAGREYDWVQGCQEVFAILGEIMNEMATEGEVLRGVRELEKFFRVFQLTCFYTDDYVTMELLDEAHIDVMEDLEELMQGLVQDQDRLVKELVTELESIQAENDKREKEFLYLFR